MSSDDLVLRAPLPYSVCRSLRSDVCSEQHLLNGEKQEEHQPHDAFVHPIICGLQVGVHVLRLSIETLFTSAVFVHRYYASSGIPCPVDDVSYLSQYEETKYVASACLLLACKRGEEPRSLRDLVNFVHMIDWSEGNAARADHNGRRANTKITWRNVPPDLNESYWASQERLVQTEQHVLQWLAFDVVISRPHRVLALLLPIHDDFENNLCNGTRSQWAQPGLLHDHHDDQHHVSAMVHSTALHILNNCMYSSEALQHPILPLTVAVITLAKAQKCDIESGNINAPIQDNQCLIDSNVEASRSFQPTNNRPWWISVLHIETAAVEAAMKSLSKMQRHLESDSHR